MQRAMSEAKKGEQLAFHVATSSVADDMAVKLFLADAAVRGRNLTKADVGDAESPKLCEISSEIAPPPNLEKHFAQFWPSLSPINIHLR